MARPVIAATANQASAVTNLDTTTRMRRRMADKHFFIAGTMQGSRRDNIDVDQTYRREIESIIHECFPDATVHCPGRLMKQKLASQEAGIRDVLHTLTDQPTVNPPALPASIQALTACFHELTDLAGQCDVCIACLPNHQASMGTAIEIYSAWQQGRTVIAVTDMVRNLAMLSCCTHIVRNFGDLRTLLLDMRDQPFG